MIIIGSNIFGAVLAFCVGIAVAAINYAISRRLIIKRAEMYAGMQVVRQMINVAFLVALYVLGAYTPWDRIWLLVGGCLGITLPMFCFTYKLVKLNDSLRKKEESSDG